MKRLFLLYLLYIRFVDLGIKAVHHDEAVNGNFVQKIWQLGRFEYDPHNFHGPLLFYLQAISEKIFGISIEALRIVPVFFSCLWLWFLFNYLGSRFPKAKSTVLFLTLSPGLLFFARSAIHETLLLFFMSLAIIGIVEIFRFEADRGWRWLLWGFFGVLTLKETWVLLFASGLMAWALVGFPRKKIKFPSLSVSGLGADLCAVLVFTVFLYSQAFTDWRSLADIFVSYMPWTKTGLGGSGHQKPWNYFLNMLWRQEFLMMSLALPVTLMMILRWRRLKAMPKWLLLTAWIQVGLYSVITYKTPWCIASFLGVLMTGVVLSFQEVLSAWYERLAVLGLALCFSFLSYPDFIKLNFTDASNLVHPYVYVQTRSEVKWMMQGLQSAIEENPSLRSARIQIAGSEPWPFVWLFEVYSAVKYQALTAGILEADIYVVDTKEEKLLEEKIDPSQFEKAVFPIRDARENSSYYFRKTLFPNLANWKIFQRGLQ